MKKFKLLALVAVILVISLISVTGAWAGPSHQGTVSEEYGVFEDVPTGDFPGEYLPPWGPNYPPYDTMTATPDPISGLTTYYAGFLKLVGRPSAIICLPTPHNYPELSQLTIRYWAVPTGGWVGVPTSTSYKDGKAYRCGYVDSPGIYTLQGPYWPGIETQIENGTWPYGINSNPD